MIIHGTEDSTIPIEHGVALYEELHPRYRAEPFWVIGKGHNDMDYNFDPIIERLLEFIEFHVEDSGADDKKKNIVITVKSGKNNQKAHNTNVSVR